MQASYRYKINKLTNLYDPVVCLSDLKSQTYYNGTRHDGLLESFGDAAQEYIEEVSRRLFTANDYELYIDGFPGKPFYYSINDDVFFFPVSPVNSITSISYLSNGSFVDVDSSVYILGAGNYMPQSIILNHGQSWPGCPDDQPENVRITFNAGGDGAVNNRVKQAVRLLTAHFWEHREASTEVKLDSIPFGVKALINSFRDFSTIS
jgi:uncharacterized phiE125 gp8 family phage protein